MEVGNIVFLLRFFPRHPLDRDINQNKKTSLAKEHRYVVCRDTCVRNLRTKRPCKEDVLKPWRQLSQSVANTTPATPIADRARIVKIVLCQYNLTGQPQLSHQYGRTRTRLRQELPFGTGGSECEESKPLYLVANSVWMCDHSANTRLDATRVAVLW